MRSRLITMTFVSALFLAAMWGAVARAQVVGEDKNLVITEFRMDPISTLPEYGYPANQAGGNPNVSLFFRFCSPGVPIDSITPAATPGNFIVKTSVPHGMEATSGTLTKVKIRGYRGPTPDVNGMWGAQEIAPGGTTDLDEFELVGPREQPPSGDDAFAPGAHAQIAPLWGCVGDQGNAKLARFELELPPGFLGNPTALETCPTHLWIASSCSDRAILGTANTETRVDSAGPSLPPLAVPTPVYNVATLGLEPARLGTNQLGSEPSGPFPVKIDLRTDGDYGIDSALIDIPKNLGGPSALAFQIDTVLCAEVPCKATNRFDPRTVTPLPPTRPFFRNPTSCKTATARLKASSWAPNAVTASATDTFTPVNCGDVPFDTTVSIEDTAAPANEAPAGLPGTHRVTLEYPGAPDYYEDDPIWQSNLRNATINLPKGMVLNPAGGYGLEQCTFEQFGVNSAGKQISKDPPSCPEGSQVGTLSVTSPVLDFPLGGKVFFGQVTAPGQPTATNPWKLYLMIEGAGLRIKLVGDVTVADDGQVKNVFVDQPEVPFNRLQVTLRGGNDGILRNPEAACDAPAEGSASLLGWRGNPPKTSTPSITTVGCGPAQRPFSPTVDVAEGIPEKAGANSTSRIVFSRPDGHQNLTSLKLSLPAGATGSLAVAPQCPLADALAGTCDEKYRIGTLRNTVGVGDSLLTVPGELYLSEAMQPGDAASISARVPAKVGPIDLGQVILMNRVFLRESDNGLEVVSTSIPTILGGVPLPIRRVEILVDRQGFFLNPTGCDPRILTATFYGDQGGESSSSIALDADRCGELPFSPDLRLYAGAAGQTDQFDHPPFQATVTQADGEADITNARVVLPAILRPNVPFFNQPGALCNDFQAATDTCPAKSRVGNARAFSPLLPYPLSGPVHIVQEVGSVLPKVYVYLRGPTKLEVLLKARNSFLGGRRIINTFEVVPDLPQSYFELNLNGGRNGILNNFADLCKARKKDRQFDATFNAHSGKRFTSKPHLRIRGCEESDLRAASLFGGTVRVSKSGVAKVKVRCKRSKRCRGRLTLKGKGATGAGKVAIAGKKTRSIKVKFSKSEVRKIRKARRLGANAALKIGDANTAKGRVTLVGPKRKSRR
jgi:hypothetical protein